MFSIEAVSLWWWKCFYKSIAVFRLLEVNQWYGFLLCLLFYWWISQLQDYTRIMALRCICVLRVCSFFKVIALNSQNPGIILEIWCLLSWGCHLVFWQLYKRWRPERGLMLVFFFQPQVLQLQPLHQYFRLLQNNSGNLLKNTEMVYGRLQLYEFNKIIIDKISSF